MRTGTLAHRRPSLTRDAGAETAGAISKMHSDAEHRAWSSVYLLATLLVLEPLADLVSQVWPLQPDVMVWRYGFAGFLGNNLLTPLLGATLALVAAAHLGHARTQRALSIVSLLVAITLLIAVAGFALDTLQLRRTVRPELASQYDLGAAIASAKYLAAILGFAVLSRTRLRGSSRSRVPR